MPTNIEAWLAQFEKGGKVIIKVAAEYLEKAAERFLSTVKDRTPVGDPSLWHYPAPKGYVPGSLKKAWELEVSGDGEHRRATISNALPYAYRVEYGWSTQAPNGMMRLTIKDFPKILSDVSK